MGVVLVVAVAVVVGNRGDPGGHSQREREHRKNHLAGAGHGQGDHAGDEDEEAVAIVVHGAPLSGCARRVAPAPG